MEWPSPAIGAVCVHTEHQDPRGAPESEFWYVDIAGVDRDLKRITEPQRLLGAEAPSRARKVIRKDDVIVSTVRPNLNAVAMVPEDLDGEIASTGFCVLRPNRAFVEPRYLFYRTISRGFVAELTAKIRGANYPAVSDEDVKGVEIPLPPPSEQRRIVEILDQADRLRRLRSDVDGQSNRILPALLNRLIGNPHLWGASSKAEPLRKFVQPISGGTPPKSNGALWKGDIPWVSPKDMKVDFLSDSQDHISSAAVEETNLSLVAEGSVLIVVRGMILARDVPLALTTHSVTINQDMKALVPTSEAVTGAYVWAALNLAKPLLRALIRTAGHGTRKLDTPDLMAFPIPRPDSGQLARVGSVVEHRRQAVDHQQKARRSLESLFSTAIGRAFDGSLTSSWREAHMKELLQEMEQQAKALAGA